MHQSPELKGARDAARRGQPEIAVESLRRLAAAGNVSACPSLAELLAFQSYWAEVITNAGRLIGEPSAADAGNVFDDMVRLLGRAGFVTGRWPEVEQAARRAIANITVTVDKRHLRERYFAILSRLAAVAKGAGSKPLLAQLKDRLRRPPIPDDELIMLWKKPEQRSAAERKRLLDEATADVFKLRPDLEDKPVELGRHLFALAKNYECPEAALERYEACSEKMSFDASAYVGAFLCRRGRFDEAWDLIRDKIPEWVAADPAQVAPVVLLVDRDLHQIMRPERCDEILRIARDRSAG